MQQQFYKSLFEPNLEMIIGLEMNKLSAIVWIQWMLYVKLELGKNELYLILQFVV